MTTENDDVFNAVTPAPSTTAGDNPKTVDPEYVAKLEKRLNDSQAFIEQLKQERARDRQLFDTVNSKMELLLQAKKLSNDDDDDEPPKAPAAPVIAPEQLRQAGFLTREDLEAEKQAEQRKANIRAVTELGKEQFGEKFAEHIQARCNEIGVSAEWAKNTAATNPNVFIQLFGLKQTNKPTKTPLEPDITTAAHRTPPRPEKPSVMYGASTEDMVAAWRRTKEA